MRQLPNLLSLARMGATLPIVVLILLDRPAADLAATALFVLAALTDALDGRLARKYHLASTLGVFLDLTADKIFVAGMLIALVQVGVVPAWITIVIVAREFVVQGLRSLAAAEGVVIPAGPLGKQKTLLTLLALGGILLARGLGGATAFPLGLSTRAGGPQTPADGLLFAADVVLLLAVLWTLFSAIEYLRGGWGVITEHTQKG